MSHHKGGFEPETNGFQFYAIANLDKTSLVPRRSHSLPPLTRRLSFLCCWWRWHVCATERPVLGVRPFGPSSKNAPGTPPLRSLVTVPPASIPRYAID